MKPVIGIFGARSVITTTDFPVLPMTSVGIPYTEAVRQCGGVPLIIPYITDSTGIVEFLEKCDGVLLPGGVDVDPSNYGEEPVPQVTSTDLKLDDAEIAGLRYMLEKDIPALGICRGCQIMNVFAGGSLYQDINTQYPGAQTHGQRLDRTAAIHEIRIEPGSRIHRLLGTDTVRSNSMHHQCVKTVGCGFDVSGRTEDGIVEMIEHENDLWLATQFHPEELLNTVPVMRLLFEDLVAKARKRMR